MGNCQQSESQAFAQYGSSNMDVRELRLESKSIISNTICIDTNLRSKILQKAISCIFMIYFRGIKQLFSLINTL